MSRRIYLDHAAATPMDGEVLAAMQPYFAEKFYNPSAIYKSATEVGQALSAARATIAKQLGVKPGEIVFTAGGTEANNLAIFGVVAQYPKTHFVTTALEHDSILRPAAQIKQQGWQVTEVKPKANGLIDPQAVTKAITDKTVLVSVMYANNEIGTIQPIKVIAAQLAEIRRARQTSGNKLPLIFHTDAAQAANYLDLSVHRLGVDLLTLNGGKIYGPKQSGVLYVSSRVKLQPLILGGGQEFGLRSGTENVAACIGLAKALGLTQTNRKAESQRLQILQQQFIELIQKHIPSAVLNGSSQQRLPNNLHFTFPGTDNERLIFALDEHGIQVAAGSACSASKEEASHVLLAMDLSQEDARASLRFTMGRGTTEEDIKQTVDKLASLI